MKKLTLDYIKEKTKKIAEGYECLSNEYINSHTHLKFKCNKEHEYSAQWANFQYGHRCPACAIFKKGSTQRFNIDYIKKKTIELSDGYKCLSEKYVNSHTNIRFKCDKGHEYKSTWGSFQTGARCRKCINIATGNRLRLSLEYVREKTKEIAEGYKLLSEEYINNTSKLLFKCFKKHSFETTWDNFQSGTRCPRCRSKEKSDRMKSITIEYIKKYVKDYGYECLSDTYIYNNLKMKFKCSKNHVYETTWMKFRVGVRCPKCSLKGRTKYDETTLQELYSYREYVDRLSNKNYCKYYYLINPKKLKRSYTEYHLDHIYSVIDGFENGILPQIIASPVNLRMLLAKGNISKNGSSDMTLDELLKAYNKFNAN